MNFATRAKIRRTEVATLRRYWSECGRYAVVYVRSKVGLPSRWVAIFRGAVGEVILGRHRGRAAAEETCRRAARVRAASEGEEVLRKRKKK